MRYYYPPISTAKIKKRDYWWEPKWYDHLVNFEKFYKMFNIHFPAIILLNSIYPIVIKTFIIGLHRDLQFIVQNSIISNS